MAIEQYTNNGTSTLNGTINNSTTSVVVTSAASFPSTGLFSIIIDNEIMTVTAVSSNTFTVIRGAEGTTATSHTNGVAVDEVETARSIDQMFLDQISVGAYASLPTENKSGRQYWPTDGYGVFINNGSGYLNYWPGSNAKLFPPVNGAFSWINQNSSAITQTGSGLTLTVPSQVGANISLRTKTLAASSNYTAEICVIPNLQVNTNSEFGLYLNDGTKLAGVTGYLNTSSISIAPVLYNSVTSFNSFAGSVINIWPGTPIWLRFVDDGTNRRYRFSLDGFNFYEIRAEGRTSFLTPTDISFGLDPSGQANTSSMTVISFREF